MNFDKVYKEVEKQLGDDKSSHSMFHIDAVIRNAKKLLSSQNGVNEEVVLLACLLHDCDDYKIVGLEAAEKMENTKRILNQTNLSDEDKEHVVNICKNMGYSKLLEGVRPKTIEGKIVSDADMLDAVGSSAIIRSITFSCHKDRAIFDRNILPRKNMSVEDYKSKAKDTAVTHVFEKLFKIRDILFLDCAKKIAHKRHYAMYDFLDNFFEENDLPEWNEMLREYK